MAVSPSHKWGQIVGGVLEGLVHGILSEFALQRGLYLDTAGERPARRGKKVTWKDKNGNAHDLDFVLERGGTAEEIGRPVAFIESAWRRYTKHSRNKAQEIQGALEPLTATFSGSAPFAGVVLAGDFTGGAVKQLESLGFEVLHFSYPRIVEAFASVGIGAAYDERTPVSEFRRKIRAWERLTPAEQLLVAERLLGSYESQTVAFLERLRRSVERVVVSVRILPLFGSAIECPSIAKAIAVLRRHDETVVSGTFIRYEVVVEYSNGDRIEGKFVDKSGASQFLRMQEID